MLKESVVFTSGSNLVRPHGRIIEGFGEVVMEERPRLVLPHLVRGKPFDYQCSRCGQPFLLPEDRTLTEGRSEVWAAFKEHVQEEHPEEADSSDQGRPTGASK
jgi:uncharacterized metal-binding protein YceD (DUF177 family)